MKSALRKNDSKKLNQYSEDKNTSRKILRRKVTRYNPDQQLLLRRAEHAYHELTETPSNPPVLVSLQQETSLSTQPLRAAGKL
jgi:hypothetical protein